MPIIKLVHPGCNCESRPKPDQTVFGLGTIWECEKCGAEWEFQRAGIGGFPVLQYCWVRLGIQRSLGIK